MGDDGSWRTQAYRQIVTSKIEDAIRQSGMNTSRNSLEMENHIFQKAKRKEEYLAYVARLILYVREMSTKEGAGMGVLGANQETPGVPDLLMTNTPGQPSHSPMGMQDEQAYLEKVRQLSKYIEPLRELIARMENNGEPVEKLSKMKKLLEILSNPRKRVPLEMLLKCEIVLKKLDCKRSDGSVPTSSSAHLPINQHHVFNPPLEAVSNNFRSSVIDHTLHRTFGPILEALFRPEIKTGANLFPDNIRITMRNNREVNKPKILQIQQSPHISMYFFVCIFLTLIFLTLFFLTRI